MDHIKKISKELRALSYELEDDGDISLIKVDLRNIINELEAEINNKESDE